MLFSPGAAVFRLAESVWSVRHKCPLLTLVIRAQKNVVAYFEAQKPRTGTRGRPSKYGEKVKISERFVMIGAIALGLLQLIALKYESLVWKEFQGFLRTKSRSLPSERTVKSVIGHLLVKDLCSFAPGLIMRKIQEYIFKKKVVGFICQRTDLASKLENTET